MARRTLPGEHLTLIEVAIKFSCCRLYVVVFPPMLPFDDNYPVVTDSIRRETSLFPANTQPSRVYPHTAYIHAPRRSQSPRRWRALCVLAQARKGEKEKRGK